MGTAERRWPSFAPATWWVDEQCLRAGAGGVLRAMVAARFVGAEMTRAGLASSWPAAAHAAQLAHTTVCAGQPPQPRPLFCPGVQPQELANMDGYQNGELERALVQAYLRMDELLLKDEHREELKALKGSESEEEPQGWVAAGVRGRRALGRARLRALQLLRVAIPRHPGATILQQSCTCASVLFRMCLGRVRCGKLWGCTLRDQGSRPSLLGTLQGANGDQRLLAAREHPGGAGHGPWGRLPNQNHSLWCVVLVFVVGMLSPGSLACTGCGGERACGPGRLSSVGAGGGSQGACLHGAVSPASDCVSAAAGDGKVEIEDIEGDIDVEEDPESAEDERVVSLAGQGMALAILRCVGAGCWLERAVLDALGSVLAAGSGGCGLRCVCACCHSLGRCMRAFCEGGRCTDMLCCMQMELVKEGEAFHEGEEDEGDAMADKPGAGWQLAAHKRLQLGWRCAVECWLYGIPTVNGVQLLPQPATWSVLNPGPAFSSLPPPRQGAQARTTGRLWTPRQREKVPGFWPRSSVRWLSSAACAAGEDCSFDASKLSSSSLR